MEEKQEPSKDNCDVAKMIKSQLLKMLKNRKIGTAEQEKIPVTKEDGTIATIESIDAVATTKPTPSPCSYFEVIEV